MKTDKDIIEISVTVEGSTIKEGSKVAVYEKHDHYHGASFESTFYEAKESLFDDIKDLGLEPQTLLEMTSIMYGINNYLSENIDLFKKTMEQIICDFCKLPKPNQIRNFIIFCLSLIISNDNDIDDFSINQIMIESKKHWLFSPHGYNQVAIEKAMVKIINYLTYTKNKYIVDGVCYIAGLVNDDRIECSKCVDGVLNITEEQNVLSDFMDTNKPIKLNDINIQNDYFNMNISRHLTFKCGNCVTNIERINKGKTILEKGIKSDLY